jgi:hypothetical protein
MTPLAQRIVKELTLPVKRRTFEDKSGVLQRMDDVHCFECSEVRELADSLWAAFAKTGVDTDRVFLPAPRTWIEILTGPVGRMGFLIEERRSGKEATVRVAFDRGSLIDVGVMGLGNNAHKPAPMGLANDTIDMSGLLYALLAIINTPRIIGRRQHMPHRGLERRLTQALGAQGRFPLNAWTEIKLQVAPPKDMSGEGSTEAHLTGQRALHFCRSHLRIRCGRLEVVRSHWRGDASLGLRQSRYRLTGAPA